MKPRLCYTALGGRLCRIVEDRGGSMADRWRLFAYHPSAAGYDPIRWE